NARLLIDEIMKSLCAGEADAAFFNCLKERSNLLEVALTEPGLLMGDMVPAMQIHRSMTISSDVAALYSHLSKKSRKNQKWQARKFITDHDLRVQIRCFRHQDELMQAWTDIEQIACKTYHRALGVGFENTPEMWQRFDQDAQMGWLRA